MPRLNREPNVDHLHIGVAANAELVAPTGLATAMPKIWPQTRRRYDAWPRQLLSLRDVSLQPRLGPSEPNGRSDR